MSTSLLNKSKASTSQKTFCFYCSFFFGHNKLSLKSCEGKGKTTKQQESKAKKSPGKSQRNKVQQKKRYVKLKQQEKKKKKKKNNNNNIQALKPRKTYLSSSLSGRCLQSTKLCFFWLATVSSQPNSMSFSFKSILLINQILT